MGNYFLFILKLMRTSSKIITLIGATQSNAFFTEFFSSKAEEPQA